MFALLEHLRPGALWEKSLSGKQYEIVDLAIDTTTNGCVVIYRAKETGRVLTRPIGEFLGNVVNPLTEHMAYSEYIQRFVPVTETSDAQTQR